ncbi:MAG: ABC transporter substrate-binding protein [Deltaproteobacteria bacterium]|nr:ABC transporter substrate-binding protein [Deltaproteobacteria bacterium]
MKKLIYAIVCSFVLSQSVMADDRDTAEQLIKTSLDEVISVLQKKDLCLEKKNSQINEIVTPMFDFQRMAMLTLGKKYWPGLSKEEKEKFTDLFVERMKDSYREKLTLYTDERVIYETAVQVKNKIKIQTYLISKDNKISILYKLYHPKGQWKIYDLEVQGVSIIQTFRSQYTQILQNGTIDDLLIKLEKPVDG